jgi:hypothetical protein
MTPVIPLRDLAPPLKKPDERPGKAIEWTKAVGMPLVTLAVTVLGGYYFTSLSKQREDHASNERLYAQLLTNREQSDAGIRKDMFGVVINSFLTTDKTAADKSKDLEDKVLKLELLANNFSQTLDLAPLFKDIARRLPSTSPLSKRLDRTAADLIFRQVQSLSRRGQTVRKTVSLSNWEEDLFGKPILETTVLKSRLVPSTEDQPVAANEQIRFTVEIINVDVERREVGVRMRINFPGERDNDVDRHFNVGPYDFPMLDNTQLPDGLRATVVMTEINVPDTASASMANSFATLHLVIFPAASASLKERQDFDEILLDMLRASRSSH